MTRYKNGQTTPKTQEGGNVVRWTNGLHCRYCTNRFVKEITLPKTRTRIYLIMGFVYVFEKKPTNGGYTHSVEEEEGKVRWKKKKRCVHPWSLIPLQTKENRPLPNQKKDDRMIELGPFRLPEKNYLTPLEWQRLSELLPYTDPSFFSVLLALIKQDAPVSLRILDWLCVNFAKKNSTFYSLPQQRSRIPFEIHKEYKQTLRCYKRRLFDPFQRKKRIYFEHSAENILVSTTVGQVAFVVWAMRNGVYTFACTHTKVIEDDMRETIRLNRKMKKKKRGPLSLPTMEFCTLHARPTQIVDNSDEEN